MKIDFNNLHEYVTTSRINGITYVTDKVRKPTDKKEDYIIAKLTRLHNRDFVMFCHWWTKVGNRNKVLFYLKNKYAE